MICRKSTKSVNNEALQEIALPTAQYIGGYFLFGNKKLTHISLPNVTTISDCFLLNNDSLEKISLPQATHIGQLFLFLNQKLRQFYAPNLTEVGACFLPSHPEKESILKNKDKPITDDKLSLNILLQQKADKSR